MSEEYTSTFSINQEKYQDELTSRYVNLESLLEKTTLNLESSYLNRKLENHGFSQCGICQAKLMAYLEKGHTFEETVMIMGRKHPNIKNIRAYTRNAIRQTTGLGIYDDYIIERGLWTVRKPILAPPDVRKTLEKLWYNFAERGRKIIEMDKKIEQSIKRKDDLSEIIGYIASFGRRG